jgi:hypothetical protein
MDVYVYNDEGYTAFVVLRHGLTQHDDSIGNCILIFLTR